MMTTEALLSLLARDPLNQRLRKDCIDRAIASKDFDTVIAAADVALQATPNDPAAQFDRATGLIGKSRYTEALALLRPLLVLDSASYGIGFNIALCHYCLAQYQEALPLLEACYARGLRDVGLLRLLVRSYHHVGRLDDATLVCGDNAGVAATDAALAGIYALVFMDVEDVGRAAQWAATALRLDPKSIDGRVTQGTLLIARLDTKGANEMLRGVIADAPQTGRAWIGLGSLALLAQDLPQARELLSRGVELLPLHAGSWHMLGWTQLMQQDVDAAERSFNRALEVDRNFAETHGAIGAIAAIRGDRDLADRSIQIARRLDADCLSAKFAESVLLARAGAPDRAFSIINQTAAALGARQQSALGKLLRQIRKP